MWLRHAHPWHGSRSPRVAAGCVACSWVDGGLAPGPIWNPIGLRSPMLGYASTETSIASKVFFARTGIVQAFGPGQTCPSTNPLFSCSGHGSCNCLAGTCRCEVLTCFYGDDCGTEQLCNENGFCMQGASRHASALPAFRLLIRSARAPNSAAQASAIAPACASPGPLARRRTLAPTVELAVTVRADCCLLVGPQCWGVVCLTFATRHRVAQVGASATARATTARTAST